MQEQQNSSVRWSRILFVAGGGLLILAFLYWNVLFVQGNLIKQAEANYIQQQIQSMQMMLADTELECQNLNRAITATSSIEESMAQAGANGITDLELPLYDKIQDQYALNNLQLLSDKGLVVWTANNPAQKSEDQSYRRSILAALEEKDSLSALEFVDEDLNVVSVVPLFHGNKYIGGSELSMHLGKALEKKLAVKERSFYSIYKLNGIERNLLWAGNKSSIEINTSDINKVQQGEPFYRPYQDDKMLVIVPLKDVDLITVAYIQGEIPRQTFLDARTNNLLFLIISTLMVLFAGYLLAIPDGLYISIAKPDSTGFKDNGKISRVSIHVKPPAKD